MQDIWEQKVWSNIVQSKDKMNGTRMNNSGVLVRVEEDEEKGKEEKEEEVEDEEVEEEEEVEDEEQKEGDALSGSRRAS